MLPALAGPGDLDDRGITVAGSLSIPTLLDSASASVRDAAGCAITQATSTITLVVDNLYRLDLPFGPVQSVDSVQLGGVEIAGWVKFADSVEFPSGWTRRLPVEVAVTYTHGYPIVPADIVDLVCSMVAMTASPAATSDSYGSQGRVTQVRLGDFSETKTAPPGTESPSPFALPDSTRCALRARFGGAAVVVGLR